MKIVFTGGHPSPAFACIEYIQKRYPDWRLVFIGRELSQPQLGQKAWESSTAAEFGIPFFSINTGKSSPIGLGFLGNSVRVIRSVVRARTILSQEKPDVVLSFGSYVAVPIAIAAKSLGIPVITHEQVRGAGKANVLISRIAKKVAVSFESSLQHFPKGKTVVTGLPLRPALFRPQPTPDWLSGAPTDKPILVAMGGSTGSAWINQLLLRLVPQLTEHALIIHQTGLPTNEISWLEQAEELKQSLDTPSANSYYPRVVFNVSELSWLYQQAALVVSRAGANTVAELLAFQTPTLFIPLPTSAAGEQEENAQHAANQAPMMSVLNQNTLLDTEFLNLVRQGLTQSRQRNPLANSLAPQEKIVKLLLQAAQ